MKRLAAYPMWLVRVGAWGFVGALSRTTAAVYLIRDVGMSPLQLVLAGKALEVAYLAAPLVSRLERLRAAALPKLLLFLNALLSLTALALRPVRSALAVDRGLLGDVGARSLADAPYRTWLYTSITDSSVRATAFSITNLAGSAGEWIP